MREICDRFLIAVVKVSNHLLKSLIQALYVCLFSFNQYFIGLWNFFIYSFRLIAVIFTHISFTVSLKSNIVYKITEWVSVCAFSSLKVSLKVVVQYRHILSVCPQEARELIHEWFSNSRAHVINSKKGRPSSLWISKCRERNYILFFLYHF